MCVYVYPIPNTDALKVTKVQCRRDLLVPLSKSSSANNGNIKNRCGKVKRSNFNK